MKGTEEIVACRRPTAEHCWVAFQAAEADVFENFLGIGLVRRSPPLRAIAKHSSAATAAEYDRGDEGPRSVRVDESRAHPRNNPSDRAGFRAGRCVSDCEMPVGLRLNTQTTSTGQCVFPKQRVILAPEV